MKNRNFILSEDDRKRLDRALCELWGAVAAEDWNPSRDQRAWKDELSAIVELRVRLSEGNG